MPTYECNERQFVENIRRLSEAHFKILVNRSTILHWDNKYGLSYLPESLFRKYRMILERRAVRSKVVARKPFYDETHKTLFESGDIVHSASRAGRSLRVPYFKVEYSFTIWGETYSYTFDALFEPDIRLGKKSITLPGKTAHRKKGVLVHMLAFKPPQEKAVQLVLPSSVLILDIKHRVRPFALY
ncbi:MAG: hypothetical protein ACE5KG_00165 [Nitrososphaerales archaeon]